MAEYYGYFNGIEYGESFVSLVNRTLVKTGVFFDGLSCSGNSMNVVVSAGSANLNGFLYNNDSELSLEVETAHATLPRIDSVMIRHDISSRRINAVIVKGTAQSNPSAPSPVRNKSYYDLKIADVLIPGGASSVSTITDTRGDADVCGLVTGYDTADLATITNRLTSLEARDYIVEQGTSGIWTYRKWNSGIAECWGRHNYSNVSATTATGSFYYARLSFPDLPFVFKTVTDRHISCTNMINQIHWVSGDAPATANSVVLGNYYVFSPKSSTTLGGSIFICVTGTWK